MVSTRCKAVVQDQLDYLGIAYSSVQLGEVELPGNVPVDILSQLRNSLQDKGLQIMADKKSILIERIKCVVITMIHHLQDLPKIKTSNYISTKLNHNYTYLANAFSQETGSTIEHFIIAHKTERIKELIMDDELNITEIAYLLNYSSVAHLSAQFKKITGYTPTAFKRLAVKTRETLHNV